MGFDRIIHGGMKHQPGTSLGFQTLKYIRFAFQDFMVPLRDTISSIRYNVKHFKESSKW